MAAHAPGADMLPGKLQTFVRLNFIAAAVAERAARVIVVHGFPCPRRKFHTVPLNGHKIRYPFLANFLDKYTFRYYNQLTTTNFVLVCNPASLWYDKAKAERPWQ